MILTELKEFLCETPIVTPSWQKTTDSFSLHPVLAHMTALLCLQTLPSEMRVFLIDTPVLGDR